MTQDELASKVGLAREQVNRYVTGKVTPKRRNAERIAAAVRLEVDELWPPGPVTPTELDRLRGEVAELHGKLDAVLSILREDRPTAGRAKR